MSTLAGTVAFEWVAWPIAGWRKGEGHISRLHQRQVGFNGTLCGIYPPADGAVGYFGTGGSSTCMLCVAARKRREQAA
jgi:glutamate/tyrosine decarboxylase-like PLP-dependent enzyme